MAEGKSGLGGVGDGTGGWWVVVRGVAVVALRGPVVVVVGCGVVGVVGGSGAAWVVEGESVGMGGVGVGTDGLRPVVRVGAVAWWERVSWWVVG